MHDQTERPEDVARRFARENLELRKLLHAEHLQSRVRGLTAAILLVAFILESTLIAVGVL
jgi:hypothetical protein